MAEDRAEGMAGQSVEASLNKPSQSSPDHAETGDHMQSNRSLTGNDDPNAPGGDTPGTDHSRRGDLQKRQG